GQAGAAGRLPPAWCFRPPAASGSSVRGCGSLCGGGPPWPPCPPPGRPGGAPPPPCPPRRRAWWRYERFPPPTARPGVLSLFLALKFLRIFSGLSSPKVGWPSVKKTMVKVRLVSLERNFRASVRASSMLVPPVASRPSTHFLAWVIWSLLALTRPLV